MTTTPITMLRESAVSRPGAVRVFRAHGLEWMEHIHLDNSVLFPQALCS